MVVVAEEDHVNHGRTTSVNGQASYCRRYCALHMTEVGVSPSERRHLSPSAPMTPGRHGNWLVDWRGNSRLTFVCFRMWVIVNPMALLPQFWVPKSLPSSFGQAFAEFRWLAPDVELFDICRGLS